MESTNRLSKSTVGLYIIAVLALVLGGVAVIYLKAILNADRQIIAAVQASEGYAASAAAKSEAADAERQRRKQKVADIEASLKEYAEQMVERDLIEGPIQEVSCDPVGGSSDIMLAETTAFSCVAWNHTNDNGTRSGDKFNARMNWSEDEFIYGFGPPVT
ncbi:hypothetical protein [Mycobacterium sp. UM_Kg1]|uniref:hypothetical protein n=1 Tax=Mycobacterium sp. UM_Kg1 TaxID=1545691 RepID=UPI0006988DD8|nr:hypothetical protein [Mycobacterium sp. UM_Kg1]